MVWPFPAKVPGQPFDFRAVLVEQAIFEKKLVVLEARIERAENNIASLRGKLYKNVQEEQDKPEQEQDLNAQFSVFPR